MAEKAVVYSIGAPSFDSASGQYEINGQAHVTNGDQGHVSVTWTATASSFTPLLPPWRTRIRDAVIEAAENDNLEVDAVMFPDFGVLGL